MEGLRLGAGGEIKKLNLWVEYLDCKNRYVRCVTIERLAWSTRVQEMRSGFGNDDFGDLADEEQGAETDDVITVPWPYPLATRARAIGRFSIRVWVVAGPFYTPHLERKNVHVLQKDFKRNLKITH